MAQESFPYRNAALPIDMRINDLLSRMTLDEKIGQLRCLPGWDSYALQNSNVTLTDWGKDNIRNGNIGTLWATFRADPWTKKSLSNGLTPVLAARLSNYMQHFAMDSTRLSIPLLLAEEAPHGHMAIGTTVFPTGLGLAATFSEELVEQVGRVIGKEIRLQGAHIAFGPVTDLARDPRWSRTEETFGEDPFLVGTLASAFVRGLCRNPEDDKYNVISTLKHFVGYGFTEGGQNGASSNIGRHTLTEDFLPPFKMAIDAGALAIMTAYNSIDGIPSTANRWLLKETLRNKWGFDGLTISDLYSIDGLAGVHHVAADRKDAAALAMKSTVDIDLGGQCYKHLKSLVSEGKIPECLLDSAVKRVLRIKMEMGLFENPYVDEDKAIEVGNSEHKSITLKAARASVTLLKNDHKTLPLKNNINVAIIGPNADNVYNQLGDYTAPQHNGKVKTLLDAVRQKLPERNVKYVKGCDIRCPADEASIQQAVSTARQADVIVVAIGGSSARDFRTSYHETGAADTRPATTNDMESGEGFDRASLNLMGSQENLLKALKQTGKPIIVVYIEGRPMDKTWAAEYADALLTAYYPGEEGGTAIADVLFGDYCPAGRLPVSIPRSIGQLPIYYNHPLPKRHDYTDLSSLPLYEFGYGLSYTTFKYDNLTVTDHEGNCFEFTVEIWNTGEYDGEEVVQLYLQDMVASTVRPPITLKRFKRIFIPKGESRFVSFILTNEDFSIVDNMLEYRTEPGDFKIMIGASSNDIRLQRTVYVK